MVETSIPNSFIPHDTAVAPPVRHRDGGGLNDLLLLCSAVLFVASVALAGGVFLYGEHLATKSKSILSQLQTAKSSFEPALIQQLARLDDRMHSADRILGIHIAPTAFFGALEQTTLQTVSLQTLDLNVSDAQHIAIKVAGVARSVNSIALQADLFSKNGVIASPIFSNITRQADGVHFDLSAVVNPAAINYVALVGAAVGGSQNEPQPLQGNMSPPTEDSLFGGQESASKNGASGTGPAPTPNQ